MEKLNATNLKNILWETLNDVKAGIIAPGKADSVATQSREILRTVNTQLKICALSGTKPSSEVLSFGSEPERAAPEPTNS